MINITIKTRTQELINLIRYYTYLLLRKTKFFEYETLPVPKRLSAVIVSRIVKRKTHNLKKNFLIFLKLERFVIVR